MVIRRTWIAHWTTQVNFSACTFPPGPSALRGSVVNPSAGFGSDGRATAGLLNTVGTLLRWRSGKFPPDVADQVVARKPTGCGHRLTAGLVGAQIHAHITAASILAACPVISHPAPAAYATTPLATAPRDPAPGSSELEFVAFPGSNSVSVKLDGSKFPKDNNLS